MFRALGRTRTRAAGWVRRLVLSAHRLLFVVEQNRDAQFKSLLTLETSVEKSKLRSLLSYSGLPISSSFIVDGVLAEVRPTPQLKRQGAASA